MRILADADAARRHCLLLIVGTNPNENREIGAYVFRTISRDDQVVRGARVTAAQAALPPEPASVRDVGLALSGGGSRAMAYHLGCLRALKDLGILERIFVLSTVSGGSVIGALYAYRDEPFNEFEQRVTALLRRGLFWPVLLRYVFTGMFLGELTSWAVAVPLDLLRAVLGKLPAPVRSHLGWLDKDQRPPRRRFSRIESFRQVLARVLGDSRVHQVGRENLSVVVNATELRTGSAFRFGSRESRCYRFGAVAKEDVTVADAAAASAACPVFLPALERDFRLESGAGKERFLLTDGGVFDNLGVSCLEPGRSTSFSSNVFNPRWIIACDAGPGVFSKNVFPLSWASRLTRSFETTHRKAQDATKKRLHDLAEHGRIDGFVLPYLGQKDEVLPWIPADLPRRDVVVGYPTDFSAMSEQDREQLSLRGDLMTRLLVSHYWAEL